MNIFVKKSYIFVQITMEDIRSEYEEPFGCDGGGGGQSADSMINDPETIVPDPRLWLKDPRLPLYAYTIETINMLLLPMIQTK